MRAKREKNLAPKTFDNGLTVREYALMAGFIPIHILVIPNLVGFIPLLGDDAVTMNFVCYCISALTMLAVGFRLLRRDYDVLCDNLLRVVLEILGAYFAMIAMNLAVSMVFQLITPVGNPNNAEVVSMSELSYGKSAAMTVFLAPIAEEIMFRAGVFGYFARRSRVLGYIVTVLLFSLYHVWSYAIVDPANLIYIIQYIPVSFLLCLVYERTRSIWGCIFFHMMVNSIALQALQALEQLM